MARLLQAYGTELLTMKQPCQPADANFHYQQKLLVPAGGTVLLHGISLQICCDRTVACRCRCWLLLMGHSCLPCWTHSGLHVSARLGVMVTGSTSHSECLGPLLR